MGTSSSSTGPTGQHHLTEIPYVTARRHSHQGGLLFSAIAGILYTKHYHIDTWAFGDLLAPAIILGQSIPHGRMANHGGDAPSAILQAAISVSSIPKRPGTRPTAVGPVASRSLGRTDRRPGLRRPPLYSSFPTKKGQVFSLYVMLYAIERFFLEFLRGDYVNLTMGLKSAQMTSVIAFVIALSSSCLRFKDDRHGR